MSNVASSGDGGGPALEVVIIASGKSYQEAASWAAPTYSMGLGRNGEVSVLLPQGERPLDMLKDRARQFGFRITHFPFRAVSENKFTSQLKCQAFLFAVSSVKNGQMILFSDADMCCLKPLPFLPDVTQAILNGKIGLVKDPADYHCRDPDDLLYLAPEERTTYVNSGLILAARSALDVFKVFVELSERPQFLRGRFNDQKVINFAMGKHFRDRLWLLDKNYNTQGRRISKETIIGHYRGGAGRLGKQVRKWAHLEMCARILRAGGPQSPLLAQTIGRSTSKAEWNPPPNSALEAAFARAVHGGLMSENQYRHIAGILCRDNGCNFLVIGVGYDTRLWRHCVQGRITCVEDDHRLQSLMPTDSIYFKFESQVGVWTQVPPLPAAINHPWDYILVDAPNGFAPEHPGRQIPIAWAAQLARKAVFVHDYERAWERTVCDKYLGVPDCLLKAEGRKDRQLAVYADLRR